MFNFPHLPAKVRRMTLCVSPGGLWRSASRPKHTAAEWRVKTAAAIILLSTVPTPAVARRALMRRPSMLHATVLFPASPRQKKKHFFSREKAVLHLNTTLAEQQAHLLVCCLF